MFLKRKEILEAKNPTNKGFQNQELGQIGIMLKLHRKSKMMFTILGVRASRTHNLLYLSFQNFQINHINSNY